MKRFGGRALAVVSVVGVVTASLAAGGARAAVPTKPASGAPIVILQMATVDSTTASFPGYPLGARVAVAAINAAGGINGRPLQLNYCDDKNVASNAAQCVQQGIAAGAVARVGSIGTLGNVTEPLLQQAGVADFGAIAAATSEFTRPVSFPLSASSYYFNAWGKLLRQRYPQGKTYSILQSQQAGVGPRIALLNQGMQAAGWRKIDELYIPPNTPDLSSLVGQLQRGNPDFVVGTESQSDVPKYWSAARGLNFFTPWVIGPNGLTPEILASMGSGQKVASVGDQYPSFLGATPGASDFRKQMTAYAPGQPLTRDSWVAWVAVNALASIIKSIKAANALLESLK